MIADMFLWKQAAETLEWETKRHPMSFRNLHVAHFHFLLCYCVGFKTQSSSEIESIMCVNGNKGENGQNNWVERTSTAEAPWL